MNNYKRLNNAFLIILIAIIPFIANSQKLPAIQQISLHAPAAIKIDGKAIEWNNTFQAYNKSINAYYTLANNDDNLYLVVQATDPLIIRKIIFGGITLAIDTSKKSDYKGVAITYPVFTNGNRPVINLKNKPEHLKDPALDKKRLDSFVYVINKRFTDQSKEIKVEGVPFFTDPLISIYNEDGIRAAVLFDNKAAYTYELAVPLKYLGVSMGALTKFRYTITLNGSPQVDDGITVTYPNDNTMMISAVPGAAWHSFVGTPQERKILTSSTNLTGEYILAVK